MFALGIVLDTGELRETVRHPGRIGLGVLTMFIGAALLVAVRDLSALWFVAVGWFLFQAAAVSAVQERLGRQLEGLAVGDVMRRTELAIDGESTVAAALDLHGWGEKLRTMPVAVDGRVTGIFGTREIAAIEKSERESALVRDAMTVIGPADLISSDVDLNTYLIFLSSPDIIYPIYRSSPIF